MADLPRFSLDVLEFGQVRELLARHTSFSGGRELALGLEPANELSEARRLRAETGEAHRLPALRPTLHLGGVHDVRTLASRAGVGGMLRPDELLAVASTARGARAWRHGLAGLGEELPVLGELATSFLDDHAGLVEEIREAIGENGEVLDSASPALGRLRAELRGAHQRLVARLREIMAQPPFRDAVQDPVVTERGGRYVLPVRAEARTGLPGIVHDQSASGATVFMEPLAVVETANRWREARLQEEREIERVLAELSARVGEDEYPLHRSVEGLARLDLARARAALAVELQATAPELVEVPRPAGDPVLVLQNARHPLLVARGTEVVPQSLELGGDFDLLLITGPNTGGKTVALKTAGLLALMAQAGLYVTADEGSRVAVFQRVQADIGDEQSLVQSLSTFSSHVTRIVRMLAEADGCSLLLLDELGAGTDPQEGSALARAVLDHLRRLGAYAIATTHYSEAKEYARAADRVENASVEFDVETLSPVYRLHLGLAGHSSALAIAERLGMPGAVLQAARAFLTPEVAEREELLRELARDRALAEEARHQAAAEVAEAQRLQERARAELEQARHRHQETWRQAERSAEEALVELRREAQRLRLWLKGAGRDREGGRAAIEAALSLPGIQAPLSPATSETEPRPAASSELVVGTSVNVPRLGVPGLVLAVRENEVEIEVFGRRVRVKRDELEGATLASPADRRRGEPAERRPPNVVFARERGHVPMRLDLRGLRVEEALERLDAYLHDAMVAGLPEAEVIHGKGSGAVRSAVREALKSNRLVQRHAPQPDPAGGDGATRVWLRS